MNKNGFIAVNLDDASQEKLREVFPPRHKKEFYHHLTVVFKPEEDIYETFKPHFGSEVTMSVMGEVFDGKGQAALVSCNLSRNNHPHVTLSCSEGIAPNYSNQMLEENTGLALSKPFVISGTLAWKDRD